MQANRSNCPINRGVEFLGDRWSLVILRDMIFVGHRGFRGLLANSREGITPSTLSARLKALERAGLISRADVPRGHQGSYTLTEAGIQLVPLLFELAHIGSILDPLTDSTEARFEGWYGDHDKIGAYMEELRVRDGLVVPASHADDTPSPTATRRANG